jgi:hypothetical protein
MMFFGHTTAAFLLATNLNSCIYLQQKFPNMEHNFNPNKGDYKYILEAERRKVTGENSTTTVSPKQSLSNRFLNWIGNRLVKRRKQTDQIKLTLPVLFEFFC